MIIVPVKEGENIDRALKKFKRKFEKTGVIRELRSRQAFIKPSVRRREEIKKAVYVQQHAAGRGITSRCSLPLININNLKGSFYGQKGIVPAIHPYREALFTAHRHLRTRTTWISLLTGWIVIAELTADPEDVTSADVRGMDGIAALRKGCSTGTVHRKMSALRAFFRYHAEARHEQLLIRCQGVKLPKKSRQLPVFVAEEALDRLLDDFKFGDNFSGIRDRTISGIFVSYRHEAVRADQACVMRMWISLQVQVRVTGKRSKQRVIPSGSQAS
ncbi:MAG: 30S ribosomal protein S21 [Marinilabiliales bacterium]|nr:30S ribosomal protein S21 [Marinilabiliales bacterium]